MPRRLLLSTCLAVALPLATSFSLQSPAYISPGATFTGFRSRLRQHAAITCASTTRRDRRQPLRCAAAEDEFGLSRREDNDDLTDLSTNKYFQVVSNVSPPELVKRFAETAPPEVQQAVRTTVMNLLGNLPPQFFDNTIRTTTQNLASLMYSMQMTGYMFRNAEYRLGLQKCLTDSTTPLLSAGGEMGDPDVSGTIKVMMPDGVEREVDASAYMSELKSEVEALKNELQRVKEQSVSAFGGDLLAYIKSLPPDGVEGLSNSISEEVIEAMQRLIEAAIGGTNIGPEVLQESSGNAVRELLLWQMVSGYNLREMEKREQMNKLLES